MTSGRRTVLITGNPGSGKTAMVAELIRLGHDAIDADDEIARWEDGPDGRRWTWDRDRLERAIELASGSLRPLHPDFVGRSVLTRVSRSC